MNDNEYSQLEARHRVSEAMRSARRSLDYVMVALIGYEQEAPWDFGYNDGYLPVRVHTTKPGNYRALLKKLQAEQPRYKLVRYGFVWVASDQHAKRLKAKLDEALLGCATQRRQLLDHWKNVSTPDLAWPVLVKQAADDIRAHGEEIEFFDDAEVERAMKARAFGGHHNAG